MEANLFNDESIAPGSPVLTIAAPWSHLILTGIKRVENRTWKLNLRERLYIHSAKSISRSDVAWCRAQRIKLPSTYPLGCIVGSVEVYDCVHADDFTRAHAKLIGRDQAKFAFGPYLFLLRDPVLLPTPIPARGRLGIWRTT